MGPESVVHTSYTDVIYSSFAMFGTQCVWSKDSSRLKHETYIPLQNGSWKHCTRSNHSKTIVQKKAKLTEPIDTEPIHLIIEKTYCSPHAVHITIFIKVAGIPRS